MRTRMTLFAALAALLAIWAIPLHAQKVVQPVLGPPDSGG